MNDVYTRQEKKVIKLNEHLQAIADDDKVLSEFTNFLGTLARQSIPLTYVSWHKFPDERKTELWEFIKVNRLYYNSNNYVVKLIFMHLIFFIYCIIRQNMSSLRKEKPLHYGLCVICGGYTKVG